MIDIASLAHDLGHGPFSHTFERFIKKTRPDIVYNHDEMTIKIFRNMDNGCDVDMVKAVCKIIKGQPLEQKSFLAHIVHNTINGLDADKLDYFIRDSQCTSFRIGCDWKRIVYESSVKNNEIVFPYKMIGDIFNLYQIRFRLYKELYYHKTVRMIEDALLEILVLAYNSFVFNFRDSHGIPKSLSNSIDDVTSFLSTHDDIIGQIERCNNPKIIEALNAIKKREFTIGDSNQEPRIAHYGKKSQNPLLYVKFVNKQGDYQQIDKEIIDTLCPQKFFIKIY